MIAYNQLQIKNTIPINHYHYLLGFIHGFTFGFISLYFIKKYNLK